MKIDKAIGYALLTFLIYMVAVDLGFLILGNVPQNIRPEQWIVVPFYLLVTNPIALGLLILTAVLVILFVKQEQ